MAARALIFFGGILQIMNDCYICAGSAPPLLRDVCACKNRHVHPACQKKLIATLETSAKCGVCKTQYKNVVIAVHRRLNWQFVLLATVNSLLACMTSVILFLFAPHLGYLDDDVVDIWCINNTTSSFKLYTNTTLAQSDESCIDFVLFLRRKIGTAVLCVVSVSVAVSTFAVTLYNKRRFPRYNETRQVRVDASYDCCTRSLDSASPDEECTQTLETRDKWPSNCDDTPEFV